MVTPIAATSTSDGSVVIAVDMNVSDAEKELAKLKSRIAKTEKELGDATKKRDKAQQVLDESSLEAEKKKLSEMNEAYKQNTAIQKQLSKVRDEAYQKEAELLSAEKEEEPILERVLMLSRSISEQAQKIRDLRSSGVSEERLINEKAALTSLNASFQEASAKAKAYTADTEKLRKELEALDSQAEKLESSLLPGMPSRDEIKGQEAIVKNLQSEWNRAEKEVEKYNDKINDASARLTAQVDEAADLQQQIYEAENAVSVLEISDQRVIDRNRELLELKERQKELEGLGVGLGYEEYDRNAARIAEITQELKEYKKALEEAAQAEQGLGGISDSGGGSDRPSEAQDRLNAYMEKSSSLFKKMNDLLGKTTEMSGALQDMASLTSGELSGAFASAGTALGGFSTQLSGALAAAGPYVAIALAAVAALKKLGQHVMEFGKQATSGIISTVKTVLNAGAAAAQNFASALKTIGKVGASAIKTIAGMAQNVVEFANSFNPIPKLIDGVQAKVKRLGQMVRRVFVFSVITSGLRAIRSQITAFLNINTELTTALRRLQGALLTAFQPIYEVVVPALTTLINVLTHAVATVTQFFASLFGTTAKRAQANAESLYNQASATTAAGEAAEEASKQLAAFDEINKLDGDKSSSGGGGATSVDMGPLFDYEYDETPFDSWGEAFSAFLDNLLDGIPKLREKFKDFADWLNDLAQKLYDMFTYPGVLDKVKQLGKELADALNDLVNWIDWELLGRALGAGLNLAINFLNSVIYGYDWKNLGKKLAEFINGLADEIDGYELGRLLWAPFKIALETLAGILENLNMPLLAEKASNIALGFFDEMKNTIDLIEWERIGDQIATFLNNIKWYEIITHAWDAISSGINALFRMVRSFIDTLEWDDIATQIYTAINDSISKLQWGDIGNTIGDAIERAFNFLKTIVKNIHWHEIGENIADFILEFDFPSALGSLADLIAAGINAAMELACGLLDKLMPEAENIGKGIAERIKNAVMSVEWKHLGEVVGNGIKTALNFVAGLLDFETFYQIGKAIGDFLIGLDWPGILEALGNAIANGIKSAVALVRGFLDSVQPNLKQLAIDIAEKINEFVRKIDWEELAQTISDGIKAALDFLITLLENINWVELGHAIGNLISGIDWDGIISKVCRLIADIFGAKLLLTLRTLPDLLKAGAEIVAGLLKGIANAAVGIVTELYNSLIKPLVDGVKNLLGIASPSKVFAEIGEFCIAGLLQGISQTWQSIVDFFSTAFETIKQTITTVWETIKSATSTTWEAIRSMLSTAWDSIKEAASTAFTNIKEKISEIWENIKEKTSSIWESIKSSLKQAWDTLKETASTVFESIKEKISSIWDSIKEKTSSIWESIKSTLKQVWDSLKSTAETAFNAIKEKVVTIWESVKSDTSSKWNEIKSTLVNLWSELKGTASEKFNEVKQSIIDKIGELKNFDWASIGKSIVDGIVNGLQSIWNSLTSWASSVKDTITGALSGATNSSRSGTFSATSGYGKTYSIPIQSVPDMGNFEIPALAKGAVIPPNREFLAVLGDQRSGTNVEAPLATIEQAVANVMNRMNIGGRTSNQPVILQIGEREFGRFVVDLGEEEYQRRGVRLVEART